MSNIYVRSTDGNNADNGSTWALAKANMTGASGIAVAGDIIYVSQVHAETTAGAVTFGSSGTNVTPSKIVCGNDAAQPPTSPATTATVTTTGANSLAINSSHYCYGITFSAGTGSTRADLTLCNSANDFQVYEQCSFILGTTATVALLAPSGNNVANTYGIWINCTIKWGNAGQTLAPSGPWRWTGGSVVSGSATPSAGIITAFRVAAAGTGGPVLIEDVDFSNLSSTVNLTAAPPPSTPIVFRNCKLPSGWSGTVLNAAFSQSGRVSVYNCDAGALNYKLWIEDHKGSIRDETTVVRSGGANDGVTQFAWRMVAGAQSFFPGSVLYSDEIALYNADTGISKTLTVEGIHDSLTSLNDHDVWLEVHYLASSGAPLGTLITSRTTDLLSTAASLPASTATWVTTGLTNPNKWKISATMTPQMKGFFLCKIGLAKANQTIRIDPKITIS